MFGYRPGVSFGVRSLGVGAIDENADFAVYLRSVVAACLSRSLFMVSMFSLILSVSAASTAESKPCF